MLDGYQCPIGLFDFCGDAYNRGEMTIEELRFRTRDGETMKVLITQDVDGMSAGEIHDLRDGYALALINANKATDPAVSQEVDVVYDATPAVETVTETPAVEADGDYVDLHLSGGHPIEDDDE